LIRSWHGGSGAANWAFSGRQSGIIRGGWRNKLDPSIHDDRHSVQVLGRLLDIYGKVQNY
jgi:hypothetical protein